MSREFEMQNGVLTAYHGPGGRAVVPEGTTRIGRGTFSGRQDLTHVELPESLIEIGTDAFSAAPTWRRRICPQTCGQSSASPFMAAPA